MKKVLITGASEGIGRALAMRFASEGFAVTAVARNHERLKSLMDEIGPQHSMISADLSTLEGIHQIQKAIEEKEFNVLVNNAGIGYYGHFRDLTENQIESTLNVNITALTLLAYSFLKNARPESSLINIASVLSFSPLPNNGVYAATKSYVLSLSETLWFENQSRGVHVFAVCPGYTLTEFSKRAGRIDAPQYRKFAQTAEEVVDVLLKAMKKKKAPFIISGMSNVLMAHTMRLLPRSVLVSLAGRTFEKYLKRSEVVGAKGERN